ncbi:MAG: endonuclease/exonuclease/phosphatase family protein [Pseudomonadota bacterium]
MRLATYNVEWFNALFEANVPAPDGAWSGRHGVTRAAQWAALGTVFRAMDADAVLVVEAPDQGRQSDSAAALQAFAASFDLRTRAVALGFANDTQQEIALLYDPDVLRARHAPMAAPDAPRFDGDFHIDLDVDGTTDRVVFSKPPLELAVEKCDARFTLIGAHLKSKAPHGARTRDAVMRQSIANRRKQLAQAIWLRRRIDAVLAAGTPLIVAGDMNDGPGLDEYESLFGRSSVEILLGDGDLYDPHAARALERRLGAAPTTARFWIGAEERYLQALLDYIMVSADLRARAPRWRIWHPLDDPACWADPALRDALVTASDHFPVTLDLDI